MLCARKTENNGLVLIRMSYILTLKLYESLAADNVG